MHGVIIELIDRIEILEEKVKEQDVQIQNLSKFKIEVEYKFERDNEERAGDDY